jgi:ABC-type dipeptide/oligopeptide/nickel transport system permease subunit
MSRLDSPVAGPRVLPRLRLRLPEAGSAWRQPLAVTGLVIIAAWLLVAIFAPLLEPYDPLAQGTTMLAAPSSAHLLGTDALGRDVLSRVIAGSRVSIPSALILVIASLVVGAVIGAVAGYLGGWADEVLMRCTDMVLAFPTIILAMVVAAALGPSIRNAIIAIVVVNWPQYARVTRSLVLGLKTREFVVAGRLLGNGPLTSLRRDILPNIAAPVLVLATLDFGNAILALSGLSFLGLGTVPPTAEWGSMVSDGMQAFDSWWIATSAGVAIFTIVLAFNFVGDALRDTLDPQARRLVKEH